MKPISPRLAKRRSALFCRKGKRRRSACHSGTGNAGTGETDPYRRPNVIEMRIQKLGLQIKAGVILRSSITNPIRALKSTGPNLPDHEASRRHSGTGAAGADHNPTVIGAIMVQRGEADAMISVRWVIIMNILAW